MNDRIEIIPSVCHGKPVIRGTRVTVAQILGALSGGDSLEDVLADYPSLVAEDVFAVFVLCVSHVRTDRDVRVACGYARGVKSIHYS